MHRFNLAAIAAALALTFAGCSDSMIRWQPTAEQKQAAAITTDATAALRGTVTPAAEPVRVAAHRAARATQTYMGLPAKPIDLEDLPGLAAAIAQAEQDAAKPGPTLADAATDIVDRLEGGTEAGVALADRLLTIAASVAGSFGVAGSGAWIAKARKARKSAEEKAKAVAEALRETVLAIDDAKHNLPSGDGNHLLDALSKRHSRPSELVIEELRS